jgi:hypothetical protein
MLKWVKAGTEIKTLICNLLEEQILSKEPKSTFFEAMV